MAGNAGRKIYLLFLGIDRPHWTLRYTVTAGITCILIYLEFS